MAKLSAVLAAVLAASVSAFAPTQMGGAPKTALRASGEIWDPMGLYELGTGEAFDTFPNMFPSKQYLDESEIKHGRMSMLGWTGIWATHEGGLGLGLHIPGMPVEPDWTKAFGVVAMEQPELFGALLAFVFIAEGESVGHSGDNFRGMSTKTEPGFLNYDPLGLKLKFSEAKQERLKEVEIKNGRAAMIAMASMFSYEAIPGSVPIMDVLNG